MSLATRTMAALAAGASKMTSAMGQTLELHDPRAGTDWEVTGHYQALSEAAELEDGGVLLRHGGDAWWAKTGNPEPETGWLVRVSGRVLQVREVVNDPLDSEWEVKLEEV